VSAVGRAGLGRQVIVEVCVTRAGDVSFTVGDETRGGFREPEAAIDNDRVRLGKICRQRFGIDKWGYRRLLSGLGQPVAAAPALPRH